MISNQDYKLNQLTNSTFSGFHFSEEEIDEEEDNQYSQVFQTSENSSECNWINLCSQNNVDSIPNKPPKKIESYSLIPINPKNNQTINLFTGFLITDDGALRYTTSLDTVSFGFHQQKVAKVEEIKKLNVIDVKYTPDRYFKNNSLEEALNFAYQTNFTLFNQISQTLKRITGMIDYFNYNMKKDLEKHIFLEKEYEYQNFISFCFQFLQNYVNQNPQTMFKYSIERLNLLIEDSEITHTGFSKSYLELIGLDQSSLIQLVNRHKKIDLIRNKLDITKQTIYCLQDIDCAENATIQVVSHIVTFDGFPIKLYQKQKTINHGFKRSSFFGDDCEYSLCITEIDVDFQDLEQLILYRQRLVNNHQNLSIDDFIRKELSYLFEDVEYSVHSQNFIDKFYNDNIKSLKELEQLKINEKKTCKFRLLTQ